MKALEALNIIKKNKGEAFCEAYKELLDAIEKELKTLEIIKKYANKGWVYIDFNQIMKMKATAKNFDYTDEELIKEFDLFLKLLKEVL